MKNISRETFFHGSTDNNLTFIPFDGNSEDPFGTAVYLSTEQRTAGFYAKSTGSVYDVSVASEDDAVADLDSSLESQSDTIKNAFVYTARELISEATSALHPPVSKSAAFLDKFMRIKNNPSIGDLVTVLDSSRVKALIDVVNMKPIYEELHDIYLKLAFFRCSSNDNKTYESSKLKANELLRKYGVNVLMGHVRAEHSAGSLDEGVQIAVLDQSIVQIINRTPIADINNYRSPPKKPRPH